MTTYYVNNTGGVSGNDGLSEDYAWKTIHKAIDTIAASEKVFIKGNWYVCVQPLLPSKPDDEL